MNIFAHRGLWREKDERNTIKSIERAFAAGYSVEIDVRDFCGELVISHDIAGEWAPKVCKVFESYKSLSSKSVLALNVKSDGIQEKLRSLLDQYKIKNYFMFDMSVPELVLYQRFGMNYYTRHSDLEKVCLLYDEASGVWLDSFYSEKWITESVIKQHLDAKKNICIVSPELHGREHRDFWRMLKNNRFHINELVSICTDYPDEAKEYFDEKD